jgi:hypothetical protein
MEGTFMPNAKLKQAQKCWENISQLRLTERQAELIEMLRHLAEAGQGIDAIPVTEDDIRLAMMEAKIDLGPPAQYWEYAKDAPSIGVLWIYLGEMDAALILRGLTRASIGVTDDEIGKLIKKLKPKK